MLVHLGFVDFFQCGVQLVRCGGQQQDSGITATQEFLRKDFSIKWDGMNQNSKSNKAQEINKTNFHTRG